MSDAPLTARNGQRLGKVVLDQLKDRLLTGQYAAGSRISIEAVKSEFGVSKQPVMDALRRLEASGLVEIVPQSGCRVAQYSVQEIQDFFSLFARFEGEIAAAAAQRRTDEQLRDFDKEWQHIEDLQRSEDPLVRATGYMQHNRQLHAVIHRMSHSRVLADLSERMWDLSDFFINTVGGQQPLSDSLTERNSDHDMIRHAIRSGSPDVARSAMETHIIRTVDMFRQ